MLPFIHIGKEVLSTYNLMAACGLITAILAFYSMAKRRNIPKTDVDNMSVLFAIMIPVAGMSAILLNNIEHNRWDFSSPGTFVK